MTSDAPLPPWLDSMDVMLVCHAGGNRVEPFVHQVWASRPSISCNLEAAFTCGNLNGATRFAEQLSDTHHLWEICQVHTRTTGTHASVTLYRGGLRVD